VSEPLQARCPQKREFAADLVRGPRKSATGRGFATCTTLRVGQDAESTRGWTGGCLGAHTVGVRNRREVWREFMDRFDPAGDPRAAVERGFYVPRPGRSLAEEIAARFEVKPSASYLLVGGVGSGKTTQLLVARDRLEAAGDVCAEYIDVSLLIDLEEMFAGALLLIAGIHLCDRLAKPIDPKIEAKLDWFITHLDPRADWSSFDDPIKKFRNDLGIIRSAMPSRYKDIVLLIDSLDRLTDIGRFVTAVQSDMAALRSLGIGVIMVGPLRAIYGIDRPIVDRFDRFHHLPTVDVQEDAEGRAFLLRVLKSRALEGLLPEACAIRLAELSGGVLRDLIALTQLAGEEAYVDGAEHVELSYVEKAADHFGRQQMIALDSKELEVLQRVREKGTFVQTSEKDLALLATRRVLEYKNGRARFGVHPTIEPLLASLSETE
jgi:hypothetical protein